MCSNNELPSSYLINGTTYGTNFLTQFTNFNYSKIVKPIQNLKMTFYSENGILAV